MVSEEEKDRFCEEIRALEASLYRLAYRLTENEEDAADVLQQTVLSAYENYANLRDPTKFKSWIFRILTNTAYGVLRRRCPTVDLEEYEEVLPAKNEDLCSKLSVRDAILELDPISRTVITLFYYEQADVRTIASVTGLSEVNVRARLSRARKRLRELLKDGEGCEN